MVSVIEAFGVAPIPKSRSPLAHIRGKIGGHAFAVLSKELATALNIGVEKARQLVKDEPGVLKLTNNKRFMYRIPENVVKRIIRRCSNPPLPNW
jgi:hypothetical protein